MATSRTSSPRFVAPQEKGYLQRRKTSSLEKKKLSVENGDIKLAQAEETLINSLSICNEARTNGLTLKSQLRTLMLKTAAELFILSKAKAALDSTKNLMACSGDHSFTMPHQLEEFDSMIKSGNSLALLCENVASMLGKLDKTMTERNYEEIDQTLSSLEQVIKRIDPNSSTGMSL